MKTKVTKKMINNNYYNVVIIGYCDLQALLHYQQPLYYTAGVYGWNADIYPVDYNTVIVTGYRPFGNVRVDWDRMKKYENFADYINSWDCKKEYDKKKKIVNYLLERFIREEIK